MQPGPGHQSTRVFPWHPPGGAEREHCLQHSHIPGVKVYNHDFCCSEQGTRLRLCWDRSDFPRADLWDLEKPPQGTLGSFASLCFSELSQTSLQLESPMVVLQTLGKSVPPGQQSHHTLSPEWLLLSSQDACPGMGHSLCRGLPISRASAQDVPSQAGK